MRNIHPEQFGTPKARKNELNKDILFVFCSIDRGGREEPSLGMFRSILEAVPDDIDSVYKISVWDKQLSQCRFESSIF